MTSNVSLPVEILEDIMVAFASQYSDMNEIGDYKYLPRWYLAPLLRICKAWNGVAEKRLYQRIAIGMNFSHTRRPRTGRKTHHVPKVICESRNRFSQVAKGLLATLSTHPHLATLVEELRLGIKDANHTEAPEWTETHARLIQMCPNLKHVDIRGFAFTKRAVLVNALGLKEKSHSPVSFRISQHGLSGARLLYRSLEVRESIGRIDVLLNRASFHPATGTFDAVGLPVDERDIERPPQQSFAGLVGNQFSLDDLLDILPERWALDVAWPSTSSLSDSRGAIGFPLSHEIMAQYHGRDINFTGRWLRRANLKLLQAITTHSSVRRLDIGIWELSSDDHALEALCECLHAWARTVESVRLYLYTARHSAYQLLLETFCSLRVLEELELHIHGQHLYFNGIAGLPQLERLYVAQKDKMTEEDMYDLSQCLQDLRKFPALRQLEIHPECGANSDEFLKSACLGRGVKLERWNRQPTPGIWL